MTEAAIIFPVDDLADPWRARAFDVVRTWWYSHFRALPHVIGHATGSTWNKGDAIAAGLADTTADVLVLADADSYIYDPADMANALAAVAAGAPWAIPHRKVYRLRATESQRLHVAPLDRPRLGHLARAAYEGVAGGGITVVTRDAYTAAGGIDRRFSGWGGEDLAFGWALGTLVGPARRFDGRLVHLWHPPATSNLRGSPESEQLVAEYRAARGLPDRMRATVTGTTYVPPSSLTEAVRFRIMANRRITRLPNDTLVRFDRAGYLSTTDPELAEQLRQIADVTEVRT